MTTCSSSDDDDDVVVVISQLLGQCLNDVDEHPSRWVDHVSRFRDEMHELSRKRR